MMKTCARNLNHLVVCKTLVSSAMVRYCLNPVEIKSVELCMASPGGMKGTSNYLHCCACK